MGRYADTVSQLLMDKGRAQAQAQLGSAQAWGQAAQQLGQIPGLFAAQQQQQTDAEQRRKLNDQAIKSNQALEEERRNKVATDQRLAATTATIDGLMQKAMVPDPETGIFTFDRKLAEDGIVQSGHGHLLPQYMQQFDALDKSTRETAEKTNTTIAKALMVVTTSGNTAGAALGMAAYLKKNRVMTDAQLQPILQSLAADDSTENVAKIVEKYGAAIPQYQELVNAETKRKGDVAHVSAETANLAATARKTGIEADQLIATGGKKTATTEAELDAAAQALLSKRARGETLSKQEAADLQGYQERKRTVSDPAALNAAERQSRGIEASIAQQSRAQTFTQQEAGRKELAAKVEQPYLDAREKADTLRNIIAAAKSGNQEAAAITPLMATLGFVTMEGVKRINTTELQQVEGAGSLLERIKGQASKLLKGQPLTEKLQNDIAELATVLEKSARKKYEDAHTATTKRYGLTDETMLPNPLAAPPKPATPPTAADLIKKYGGG